ncbi:Ion transport protein [Methyloligella halotolerans]|uniref:Ion transport protein n=1 Tax=Methyloligella halotolerans TaxID=1177755 RepID=A0A1E2RV77_9HYPH|nr:ion transporter [Methyloligella halotolerans]ODA66134.1 Ion transport protein [Methyloligella halotolerans]
MQEATLPSGQNVIERLRRLVESRRFTGFITAVILFNAVTLGLETWSYAMEVAGGLLVAIDRIVLAIFVFEMIAKLLVYRQAFFRSGWNIFDLTIVGIALVPAAGPLTVLRALRILRVLRLLSVVPQMRSVVAALIGAIPGMGSIAAVMSLIFYVGSVLATKLFGAAFPDWFGSIGASAYSLFQIMTLESWSMGIVRPVMEVYPWAWLFFVPFILITTFAVLNLVVAVIVNSMQTLHEAEQKEEREAERQIVHEETAALTGEVRAMRQELSEIKALLGAKA